MNVLRSRLQRLIEQFSGLIEQLPEESLGEAWAVLQPLYYDLYVLTAVQESMQNVSPGDALTRAEALRFLQTFPRIP